MTDCLRQKRDALYDILRLLGGRAAEWVVYRHLSTGAADDLARVTDIARAIVTRYGMTERLGHVALDRDRQSFLQPGETAFGQPTHDYSDETADAIDGEIRRIIDDAFERATGLLTENRELLEKTARALLAKETLDSSDLRAFLGAEHVA